MSLSNYINITGITRLDCYPQAIDERFCKQTMENDVVSVPCKKPDIESINEVKVCVTIDCFDVIDTFLGPKLIVKGTKSIKILYTANNHQQSCHSAHWDIPFCDFVLLKGLQFDSCCNSVKDVFVGVESVIVKDFDCRHVDLSILYILCPVLTFKKGVMKDHCMVLHEECDEFYNGKKVKLSWNEKNQF